MLIEASRHKKLNFETNKFEVKGYYYIMVDSIDITAVVKEKGTNNEFVIKREYLLLDDLVVDFLKCKI